jgi:uncharacterized protein YbjT (DUF2867 family)
MNVILTGATGVAGSEALRQCLADAAVARVTVLTRRSTGVTHAKLTEVTLADFLDYGPVQPQLEGHDACLWCLGISQRLVTLEEYERITFDYALAGARAMAIANPRLVFCFLSGAGADSRERSRVTFARVKGRTENALLALAAPVTYCFRPGFIQPDVPRRLEDRIGALVAPVMRLVSRQFSIRTADLARHGAPTRILDNAATQALADEAR